MPNVAPIVRAGRAVLDDDDLRGSILGAARTSRRAVLRPAPKPTRVRRIGMAIGAIGGAVTRAGAKAEAERRARRRSLVAKGVLVAAGTGAVATALLRAQSDSYGGN